LTDSRYLLYSSYQIETQAMEPANEKPIHECAVRQREK
jgi:hypothetical protein